MVVLPDWSFSILFFTATQVFPLRHVRFTLSAHGGFFYVTNSVVLARSCVTVFGGGAFDC